MALNLTIVPGHEELKPRITVFGVGGAGGNAVNNMIDKKLEGVEFVVANTDAQALQQSQATSKVQMGIKVTEGLGAGARPSVGAAAAEETIEEIVDQLAGAHMCFITAGMGGGTGTGAAPIIAQAARELGVLTVGVVTKPFQFEGAKRMRQAEEGIAALQKVVDTLIIIPNQNLFRLANEKTTFTEAFAMADDVLYQGVKGVTDLMVRPGLINLDFADVRAVMDEMGKAMMGTGEASGENRAVQAAEKAIANPLLDEISLNGARGVLINITGGYDLTLFELDEAANIIREKVDPDANIIVGSTLDTTMEGSIRVSVVATGIEALVSAQGSGVLRRAISHPLPPVVQEQVGLTETPMSLSNPRPAFEQEVPNLFAQFDAEPAPQVHASNPIADMPHTDNQSLSSADIDRVIRGNPEGFIAPAPRAPGTPSPEALQKLQAAVNKMPASAGRQPMIAQTSPRTVEPQTEKPRFGIGSLINRMAGYAEPSAAPRATQTPSVAAASRQTSAILTYDDEQDRPESQDRIEIPAFLRRQAN
ncbi:MAG TPA: cell division protein FtsZ [Rhodobacter sp.]|nr:cell division protein FtsZ [Rhodobacter sp.]HCM97990.1 cell division protein FtsZ [Rhodobacter sp.]